MEWLQLEAEPELMEALRSSRDVAHKGTPEERLEVFHHYDGLKLYPGFRHYVLRQLGLREDLRNRILQGERTSLGEDLSPYYRFALAYLERVIAIPFDAQQGLVDLARGVGIEPPKVDPQWFRAEVPGEVQPNVME